MKKMIKNMMLLVFTVGVVFLIALFLKNDSPIPVNLVKIDAKELAAKKEAAAQEAKKEHRRQQAQRVTSCKTDADCIIVDKDPCGCFIGPKGVTAINANYVVDFNAINNQQSVMKACPEKPSTVKECSPSARPVCKARKCKIAY